MELYKSKIYFDEITHSYVDDLGIYYMGVTSLMKKHGLSPDYSNIPQEVLERAAERGSKIHKDIEEYCKNPKKFKVKDLTKEQKLFKSLKLKVIANEYLVSDNEMIASSIDVVLDDYSLADIKTTSTLHIEPLSWQLSIYAYLFEMANNVKVPALYGIHIRDGKIKVVEVDRKPNEYIIELLRCEKYGEKFSIPKNDSVVSIDDKRVQDLLVFEKSLVTLENQKKELEQKRDLIKSVLLEEMNKRGIKSWELENISLSIKDSYTTKRLDSTRLKNDYPDLIKDYYKENIVKESLIIKIK